MFVTVAPETPRYVRQEKGGKQEAVIRGQIFYNGPRTVPITPSASPAA